MPDLGPVLAGRVCLVAHDAGGAEMISSYARRAGLRGCTAVVGPAQKIIPAKLPDWPQLSMAEAVSQSDWMLCGTSWQSDFELRARELAGAVAKPVIAFLDHWVAYGERFLRHDRMVLPDELWVGDAYAEAIARRSFPSTPVSNVGNPYLDEIVETLAARAVPVPVATASQVLYVCEPIAEQALRQHGDRRYFGYTEEEALEYFFNRRNSIGLGGVPVILRPHPAEREGKYDWVARQFSTVVIGGHRPLLDEIAVTQAVVGCESMAMVIALLGGKRVISSIPPGGVACSLPHAGIEKLRDVA